MRVAVDEKGRVQLPADVRREAHIEPGNEVDVSAGVGGLIITLIPPSCAVCGTQRGLLAEFGDDPVRHICTHCADDIACHTLMFNPTKKG